MARQTRKRPTLGLGLLVAVGVVAVLATAGPFLFVAGVYLVSGLMHLDDPQLGPACTAADQEVWKSVDHYEALEPRGPADGTGCSDTFATQATAVEVLDHYQGVLTADGWHVVHRHDLDPAATPPPAPPAAGPFPSQMQVLTGSLRAGRAGYSIAVDWLQGWVGLSQSDGQTDWRLSTRVSVHVWPVAE